MGVDEQLQWERKNAPWAAAGAVLAGILPIVATIYGSSVLGKVPSDREDIFLQRVHDHSGGYIVIGVIAALGTIALIPVLFYLYRAVLARRSQIPTIALVLALAAPIASGAAGIARQVTIINSANAYVKAPVGAISDAERQKLSTITDAKKYEDEVNKLGPTGRATQELKSGGVTTVAYLGLIANLLLGLALVLISMHAMRAGLLSRFMGVLGVIVGALTAIPLLGGAPVVQLFWLVAMGVLILNRWPQGRGPAWDSGEAQPWPTANDRRDALGGGESRRRPSSAPVAQVEEPQHTREPARPRPATATHPRSKKRKRKRG